ncbi:hypothetical protein DY000_02016364 [Brassica cretica]|uniref:Uncharacterized protein n=1 Tax=Brassica cretica TaxID=69181 RepID=A0ABQ7D6A2_BRACR|nr:hypothetical protein DY000_02016364 [Brassica cretica]
MEGLGSVCCSPVKSGVRRTGCHRKKSNFYVTTRPVGTTCPVGPRHKVKDTHVYIPDISVCPVTGPKTSDQLVTTHPGGVLLKGEVLGSRLTNNLTMKSERTHNGGVGVGALQGYEPDSEFGLGELAMSMSVAASVSVFLGRIRLSLPRHCLCFLEFRRASLLILRSKLNNVWKPPRTSPGLK